LSLVNPSLTAATVTIEVDSASGTKVASSTVTINPGQQLLGTISNLLPAVTSQVGGFVHVTASQPIYGLEIFGNAGNGVPFLAFVPSGAY
jgi:hypothetical protein